MLRRDLRVQLLSMRATTSTDRDLERADRDGGVPCTDRRGGDDHQNARGESNGGFTLRGCERQKHHGADQHE